MVAPLNWMGRADYYQLLDRLEAEGRLPAGLAPAWAVQKQLPTRSVNSTALPPLVPYIPAYRRPLPCVHLDLEKIAQRCPAGDPYRHGHECGKGHGTAGIVTRGSHCERCHEYVARILQPVTPHDPGRPLSGAGVVVGTYGFPRLAELQIRLIRWRCGDDVPILIADDGSPAAEQLEALEAAYPDVTVWVSPERRGHYAGDLSVLWKGLQWAQVRGLKYLAKLSQRMLIDRAGWLDELTGQLECDGAAVASQHCTDNGVNLYVRSEFLLLDVARWAPLAPHFDRGPLRNPTELEVWHRIYHHFGARICPVPWLTVDRYQKSEGCVWHGSHSREEFAALAAQHGMGLDADFYTTGHTQRPGYVKG